MRLLLVEDNERFAGLLKRGLAAAGFVVDVMLTASDAAAALRANRFEVVVLDLGLPDADGLDVLGEMRRREDATPVLILTARGSVDDCVIGLQSGADDYLVKPFALEELVARRQHHVDDKARRGETPLEQAGEALVVLDEQQPHEATPYRARAPRL